MPFALNLYHDQIVEGAVLSALLPAAQRLIYVRHGSVVLNGRTLNADDAIHCDGPVMLQPGGAWTQLWRWELALPNAQPARLDGTGVLSHLKMSRVITHLPMLAGTKWLLRLDRITSTAGRIADRHQHPGPGIRCLLEGTFNVESAESERDMAPGDAWYETGPDTVVAWGSPQMAAKFLRGMVLPVEWRGKVTGTWLSGEVAKPQPGNWKLLVDEIIEIP